MASDKVVIIVETKGAKEASSDIKKIGDASKKAFSSVNKMQESLNKVKPINLSSLLGTKLVDPYKKLMPQMRRYQQDFYNELFGIKNRGLGIRAFDTKGYIESKLIDPYKKLMPQARAAQQKMYDELFGAKPVKKINDTSSAITGFIAVYAGIYGLSKLSHFMDSWVAIENRIKLTTNSLEEFNSVFASVSKIANATRSDLFSTAMAYNRAAISTEQLGLKAEDLNKVVKVVNQTLKISGSTAQEARASLIQFFQGMASGQLRGEEFRSVTEANIRLTKLLKDELTGGDLGKLREQAFAGQLTADRAVGALLANAQKIDDEFKKINPTIAEGFTILSNRFIELMGKFNNSTGFTNKFYKSMSLIADNIDLVVAAIGILIATSLPMLIARLSSLGTIFIGMNPYILGVVASITALTLAFKLLNYQTEKHIALFDSQEKTFKIGGAIREIQKLQAELDGIANTAGGRRRQGTEGRYSEIKELIRNLERVKATGIDSLGLLNSWWDVQEKSIYSTTKSLKMLISEYNNLSGLGKGQTIMSLVGDYGFKTSTGSQYVNPTGLLEQIAPGATKYLKEQGLLTGNLVNANGKLNEELLKQVALRDENFEITSAYKGSIKDIGQAESKITELMDKWNVNWKSISDPKGLVRLYNVFALLNQQLFETGRSAKELKTIFDGWNFGGFKGYGVETPSVTDKLKFQTAGKPNDFIDQLVNSQKNAFDQLEVTYMDMTDAMTSYTINVFDTLGDSIVDNITNMFTGATDSWKEFAHQMSGDLAKLMLKMLMFKYLLNPLFGGTPAQTSYSQVGGSFMNMSLAGRAGGGSVNANTPYIVGEKRPELFVPSSNGTIIPSLEGLSGGGGTVNNNYIVLDSELPSIMANSKANEKATMNIIRLNKETVKQMLKS